MLSQEMESKGIEMKIWFNHWFSTAYHLINMMKELDVRDLHFIGTSTNPYALYGRACDKFYEERHDMSDEDYLQFCLDFCVEHSVDIFVPRHNLVSIVENRDKFENINVKVFAENNAEIVKQFDDKFCTCKLLKEILPDRVPKMEIAHDIDEFRDAVGHLEKECSRVCYKLATDEGARSFRVIDDGIESAGSLYNKPGNKITREAALSVLKGYDFKIPVIVMPFLDGEEISVDCLATNSGKIIIPRYKTNKRYSEVIFNKELMDECSSIIDRYDLQMPVNIQYKKGETGLYLLEINTRMSGGLQLSCKASGINVPVIALSKIIVRDSEWSYPEYKSMKVAHIETPICLQEIDDN